MGRCDVWRRITGFFMEVILNAQALINVVTPQSKGLFRIIPNRILRITCFTVHNIKEKELLLSQCSNAAVDLYNIAAIDYPNGRTVDYYNLSAPAAREVGIKNSPKF